jgi:hypothetical protein
MEQNSLNLKSQLVQEEEEGGGRKYKEKSPSF